MKKILIITIICYTVTIANAQNWTAVGSEIKNVVYALDTFNSELYAGGNYNLLVGNSYSGIAKWNGLNWSAVGTELSDVYTLLNYNSELYVGGNLTINNSWNIVKWNGANWFPLAAGLTSGSMGAFVYALAVYDNEVIAGGSFSGANGGVTAKNIAGWNGANWLALGTGNEFSNIITELAVYKGELYIGVQNYSSGIYISKWDGANWSAVGSGVNSYVGAFAVFNSELYVGGSFTIAGGDTVNHIAKWNGTNWFPVGTGMNSGIGALAIYNGELYAGGAFTMAGGSPANRIAKWNGTSWSAVGAGMNSTVRVLCVYNGSLYAGGEFTMSGSDTVRYIARLDTTTGIKQNFINDKVFVYPNPCMDKLCIEQVGSGETEISLFDISGKQIVKELKSSNKKTEIDMSRMETGVYFLKVKTGEGFFCRKIIKQ